MVTLALPTPPLSSPHRNLEKEISFDFGSSAEFSYMYDQCYEMTTSEYVPDVRDVYIYIYNIH